MDGWSLLAHYLYHDALVVFRGQTTPRAQLGLAASLLNDPPVTNGKIAEAQRMLNGLITGRADPAVTAYALYLQARILHQHLNAPVPEVEAAYRAVIQAAPGGPEAQLAASHLALMLLYERPDLKVPDRLAAAAALAPVAAGRALPEVAAEFYRQLAAAAMFYGVADTRVTDWLQQARDLNPQSARTRATLDLQIAETARLNGQRARALAHYEKYLGEAVPTDQRYLTAKVRMEDLQKETAP